MINNPLSVLSEVVNAVKVFMRPRGETGREMTTVEEIKQVISDGGKGYWPSLDEKSAARALPLAVTIH